MPPSMASDPTLPPKAPVSPAPSSPRPFLFNTPQRDSTVSNPPVAEIPSGTQGTPLFSTSSTLWPPNGLFGTASANVSPSTERPSIQNSPCSFSSRSTVPDTSSPPRFGAQASSQPTGFSSLFGNTSAQTSKEPQPSTSASSLFGRPVAEQARPPAHQFTGSTGGLFGSPASEKSSAFVGLFANQTTVQSATSTPLFSASSPSQPNPRRIATPKSPRRGRTPTREGLLGSASNTERSTSANGAPNFVFGASLRPPMSEQDLLGQVRSLSIGPEDQTSTLAAKEESEPRPSVGDAGSREPTQTDTPYNIANEAPPIHEFFTSSVSETLCGTKEIIKDLGVSLREAEESFPNDIDLNSLATRALLGVPRDRPRSRTIAVLGDSGQGKSSLINSLLNLPGIAHTSDTGSACTSVVTEYHQKIDHQIDPILIFAELYTGAELEELVKELSWSYRQLYLPDTQRSELTSDQDYAKYQKESDLAWSALHAAFKHHSDFSAEFLRDFSDGATLRINQQLIQWANDIKWPSHDFSGTSSVGTLRGNAKNAEDCCEKTRAFMEDSLWPFTKVIRVHLSSPILDGGVVLTDLPGLRDTNLARVKATQDYLLRCDKLLIVSKIARAITDQSVKDTLLHVVARHAPMEWEESGGKKLKLAIVCTEADRINVKTAKSEFCGKGKRIPQDEIERFEADIQAAKAVGDEKKKKAAKRRLEFALVSARAAHVADALQKRYLNETKDGHLDVFCVGNEAYEKFCRKGIAEFVQASGIPKLRQYCITIAADDRLQEAKHAIRHEAPSLLTSAELWASSHMLHGAFDEVDKSNIQQHLDNIRCQVPEYIAQLREAFIDCFEEQVMRVWEPQQHKWRKNAIKKAEEWEKWRWNSYNAWCRRNGKHSTSAHPDVDWNAQIIQKMRMEVAFEWDILEEEIPTLFEKLTEKVCKELTWFKDDSILQASATRHRDMLISSVEAVEGMWEYNAKLEEQKLTRSLSHIRMQATETNETSYILGEMLGPYRAASAHSGALLSTPANSSGSTEDEIGAGIFARQTAEVGGHIRGETLFPNMAIRLSSDMEALVKKTEESLGMLAKQVMERLDYDVKMALKEGELIKGTDSAVVELKRAVDELRERFEELPKF